MSWILKGLGIAVLGLSLSAPAMAARVVVAGPRIVAGPRVVVRPYRPFGWYGTGFYGPVWRYPGYPYAVRPTTGEVKIDTDMKDASLYVDGGFVGPVRKFKKIEL